MMSEINPGLILIAGALLVPLLPGLLRKAWVLALPLLALAHLWDLPDIQSGQIQLFDMTLTTLRVDGLSRAFGIAFLVAALLAAIYALHVDGWLQHTAALVYAGSAVGAVFAGDLVTLFVFWEITAVSSVFLIWAARNPRSDAAGLRYLIVQVGSGVLLFAGVLVILYETGSIAFDDIGIAGLGGQIILLAFGIKACFPLLNNWMQDAYPEATVSGTVVLSAFTTKLAIYALARGFAGTEILLTIGAIMVVVPLVFALIEDDLRRTLAYALNNQLGFMVVGIGIGTPLAINGAVAHAFAGIVYMALLFMASGAVLYRTGTAHASQLSGLYRTMPWTTGFFVIGVAAMSAVPLFSAFASKSLIMSAAGKKELLIVWLVLIFGSAGLFVAAGLRPLASVFFSRASGPADTQPSADAATHMKLAMALAAALSVALGAYPSGFYALLPHDVKYDPYTLSHVLTQFQLLAFAALGFAVLQLYGLIPRDIAARNLDTDWIYRRPGRFLASVANRFRIYTWEWLADTTVRGATRLHDVLYHHHGPKGWLGKTWPTGIMAFWTTVMLGAVVILSFLKA